MFQHVVLKEDTTLPDKWQAGVRTGAGPPSKTAGMDFHRLALNTGEKIERDLICGLLVV
ncbi:MAG: hypothetical protein V3V70_01940 [Candidatus Scalindua sp.]